MIKLITTLFLAFLSTGLFAQTSNLERVEPAFWWTGMKNPKLQLLVHGQDISSRTVKLNYPGVKLAAVHKVENPNYLFLDLEIAASAKTGSFPILFAASGKPNLQYKYELKARNLSANRAQGVTSKDVIYLLMPDRFSNGDKNNDVVKGLKESTLNRDSIYHRHGGDIQGLMNHLDYLKDLGVTALWMTPEIENDQPHASYHGYAVTDYYKIDPRFGTNELYKAYVEKCHSMGLKVVKDLVHNHIGTESWLIKDMPMKDWVHQWPKYTNSNFRDAAVMDPHGSAIDKKVMLDGWFDHSMADVNQTNPYVQNYLTKYKVGMALLLTIRGIPQLYYGDEILMKNYSNPDGLVRLDFPGGWPGDKVDKFTASGRTEKENEAFNFVRKLANYRKNTTALQTGKLMQYIPQDGVYVFFRYDQQKTVMIAYNSSDKAAAVKTGRFAERTGDFTKALNVMSGEQINAIDNLNLAAKSITILELK
ncbi:MAG: hypothetical protein EOP42_16600 [Sphingobacteriaceae bacterium]|nr:MAG: hypothetical protein EOP42_16600 [Sphingobacteriaceae bacterium]